MPVVQPKGLKGMRGVGDLSKAEYDALLKGIESALLSMGMTLFILIIFITISNLLINMDLKLLKLFLMLVDETLLLEKTILMRLLMRNMLPLKMVKGIIV